MDKIDKYLKEATVHPNVLTGWINDLQIDDKKIDRVIDFAKRYANDNKLAKDIDKFYNEYYRKLTEFENRLRKYTEK